MSKFGFIRFSFSFIFVLFFFHLMAQPWIKDEDMAQPNFFKIQEQFETYWKDRPVERSCGYKPFKRWEWYWQNRVLPDGSFPPAGMVQQEFEQYYKRNHQKQNGNRLPANWQSKGPSTSAGGYAGHGRVNTIAFDPITDQKIYVGTGGGGFWKTSDGGTTWSTSTDGLGTLGVSAIAVDYVDPNIIYIGTGDGDASDNYSIGILKSTDGGATFNPTGLNWSTSSNYLIRRIVMDPSDPNVLLAATSDGIYKTTNAGTTWTQKLTGNFYDIEANPHNNSNTFLATSSNKVYKSNNQGETWTNPYTVVTSNRLSLAVTPADTNYIYVLSSKSSGNGFNGFFRSTNGGGSFTSMSTTPNILGWEFDGSDSGGQGWYDLALTADPNNANKIFIGGVNTWQSTNGGTTWTLVNHWSGASGVQTIHADKHVLAFRGTDLWEGNDGGVYKSSDGGVNWTNKTNGIVHSQMYRLGVSQSDGKVITGLQDNGTKLYDGTNWTDAIGGDGMECIIHKNDGTLFYGEYYNGNILRTMNEGQSFGAIKEHIGSVTGAWVTPYILDPNNSNTLYIGYSSVYKSINRGDTFTNIGSLGIGSITYMAVAPSNASVIVAGHSTALRRTINGGTSWSTITLPGSNVTSIYIDSGNENIMYITMSNYTAGSKVYKTINGGSSWTNMSGTLPNIPANCIIGVNGMTDALYLGMDVGIYRYDTSISDWVLFNTNLPNVEVTELEINYQTGKIFASTYGRGLWSSDLFETLTFCDPPSLLAATDIGDTHINIQWNAPVNAPANGYDIAIVNGFGAPTTFTNTTSLTHSFTGLLPGSLYIVYIRSKCSSTNASTWISLGQLFTSPACNIGVTDSGGSSNNYRNGEDLYWTICGPSDCYKVKLEFTSFSVESGWDALYVHNGNNISTPIISSGLPITLAGFPAGGFTGTSSPGTVTSTHSSGCLTLRFLSDEGTRSTGWAAQTTCIRRDPLVTNDQNSGAGSFRYAIDCIMDNDTVTIAPALNNQNIALSGSSIDVNKNMHIIQSGVTSKLVVTANDFFPIFNVFSGKNLDLKYVDLFPDAGLWGRAIVNNGTLTLSNVNIIEAISNLGSGSTIQNNGQITIKGNSHIKSQ